MLVFCSPHSGQELDFCSILARALLVFRSPLFFGGLVSSPLSGGPNFGKGPNTVSGSTVSNTELGEFFGAHRVPGSELSEFLSAYYLCAKAR